MNNFSIDLGLRPTTFDLWHVCLAGAVLILCLLLIVTLIWAILAGRRNKEHSVVTSPPEIKIVEKIVEVEKIVQTPAPEPIILKEASPDAACLLLSLLQREARFIDFIKEDMSAYSDTDIGAAARIVHQGCRQVINEHFTINAISQDVEGNRVTLNQGFDANAFRLTGNIVGEPPFTGTLVHKGWRVDDLHLPKLTEAHNPRIIAAAEVEL
jgi:hypothetical protein